MKTITQTSRELDFSARLELLVSLKATSFTGAMKRRSVEFNTTTHYTTLLNGTEMIRIDKVLFALFGVRWSREQQ